MRPVQTVGLLLKMLMVVLLDLTDGESTFRFSAQKKAGIRSRDQFGGSGFRFWWIRSMEARDRRNPTEIISGIDKSMT